MSQPVLSDAQARDLLFVVTAIAMFALAVDIWSAYLTYPQGWWTQLPVGGIFALAGGGLLAIRFTKVAEVRAEDGGPE